LKYGKQKPSIAQPSTVTEYSGTERNPGYFVYITKYAVVLKTAPIPASAEEIRFNEKKS